MQTAPAPEPVQARSIATRERLLDATVQALVAHGYAGASTTVVAKLAGVSQGALYKHFPSKALLLESALRRIFATLLQDFDERFAADPRADRLAAAFEHLWAVFGSDVLQAAFELYLAARTDETLARAIAPVLAEHRGNIDARGRALFPLAAAQHPGFDGIVHALMNTMQGAALAAAVMPLDDAAAVGQRAAIERMARLELAALVQADVPVSDANPQKA